MHAQVAVRPAKNCTMHCRRAIIPYGRSFVIVYSMPDFPNVVQIFLLNSMIYMTFFVCCLLSHGRDINLVIPLSLVANLYQLFRYPDVQAIPP